MITNISPSFHQLIIDHRHHCQVILQIVEMIINAAVISFASSLYNKKDYHTSTLSGAQWINELLEGHPDWIHCELDINKCVFRFLKSTTPRVLH